MMVFLWHASQVMILAGREILDADGDPAFAMCSCKGSRRLAASRKDTQVVQTVGVVMLVD